MAETDLRISTAAYDRFAAVAAAEGVSVREYVERIADGLPEHREERAAVRAETDLRLVLLGIDGEPA
ncbi:hypothetical protein [Streptomyces sporangiiformans]|uniref:Uncharacterized protein n=1 Tax=Streptomyces sporangiiformans TaxID=2315329 RepID=A0A505D432_9ACTN|nr:hypothetical protein [Streptomyces sporangiiformans]TPQ15548.1 hypothetical protein FGD71_046180 [Streptomyces sporangiiformans]